MRPQAPGALDETRWEDGKVIALEGEVSGETLEDAFDELRVITDACLETLDVGPALLKWTEGNTGNALQRRVRLASDLDPPIEEGAALLRYAVQFFAEDPRAYSQTESSGSSSISGGGGGMVLPDPFTITFDPSLGGIFAVNNAGNRPTPATFKVYGQCVDPIILLVDTGDRITLSGTINLGDYVEINTAERTVKLNGVTSRLDLLDSANTQWFELPKGTATLRMLASSNDANALLHAAYRSAYA